MNLYKTAKYGDIVKSKYLKQDIPEDTIDSYISKFDIIRKRKDKELFENIPNVTIPKEKRHDISSYVDFHQLELVVDHVKGQKPIGTQSQGSTDVTPIFENEDIAVYRANNSQEAIAIRGSWNYNWCVAADGKNNLYNTYRYDPQYNEPTFYFVKDKKVNPEKLNESNKYHFCVIQARNNNTYILTSARNDGDNEKSWETILKNQPKLNGLQSLFKNIPLTDKERENYNKFKNGLSDEEFIKLPYDDKRMYLDVIGYKGITANKFISLPKDLKSHYIGFKLGLDDEMANSISNDKQLMKRYREITNRKLKELKDYNKKIWFTNSEQNFLSQEQKQEYTELSKKHIKDDICSVIDETGDLYGYELKFFKFFNFEQKKYYLDIVIDKMGYLDDDQFQFCDLELKKYYLDKIIFEKKFEAKCLSKVQFEFCDLKQKKIFINNVIAREDYLDEDQFKFCDLDQKKKYISYAIYKYGLTAYEFQFCDSELKKKYINSQINNGYGLTDKHFEYCDNELKKYYIDYIINKGHYLSDKQFELCDNELKKRYIDYIINDGFYLIDEQFELCDNELKKYYIDYIINYGSYISEKQFEYCDNEQKKKYIANRIKKKGKLTPFEQEYYNNMNKKVEASKSSNRLWNSYFNNNYIGKL